jgi:putative transcription factor
MEDCELCGRKTDAASVVEVEGVEFRVCEKCVVGKKVIYKHQMHDNARGRRPQQQTVPKEDQFILVANYGEVIRKARERMDLPLKVVAEMLNEKHSLLLRIEEERAKPTQDLVKKLEKFLEVSLMEKQEQQGEGRSSPSTKQATLGEFVKED